MNNQVFTFPYLPEHVEQLKQLPEASMDTPFKTAALTVLALCRYEKSPSQCIEMLNFLKGPQPLSPFEVQFLRDRLVGKGYVPRSYIGGTSPENNYEVVPPYTIEVFDNPYSYQNEGYAMLYITSSGADSPRQVKLRRKQEQWFLWENFLLPDIRQPKASDPWA